MDKFRVTLAEDERAEMERSVSVGKGAARRLTHARILLLADDGQGEIRTDEDIAAALGCGLRTIARVRKRFVTESVDAAVSPRPQPPRPDKVRIRGGVEQRLVELAGSDPPRGRCHWTLRLLGDELVALGLVERISTETVRQALEKTT
jgi:Homeodomain-like domain